MKLLAMKLLGRATVALSRLLRATSYASTPGTDGAARTESHFAGGARMFIWRSSGCHALTGWHTIRIDFDERGAVTRWVPLALTLGSWDALYLGNRSAYGAFREKGDIERCLQGA